MTNVGMFDEQIRIEKLEKRVKELMEINKDHQKINGELRLEAAEEKKRRQFAEGELSIVKTNSVHQSPEMRNAQSEIAALKQQLHMDRVGYEKSLALEKEDHQYDNLVHKRELLNILKK